MPVVTRAPLPLATRLPLAPTRVLASKIWRRVSARPRRLTGTARTTTSAGVAGRHWHAIPAIALLSETRESKLEPAVMSVAAMIALP